MFLVQGWHKLEAPRSTHQTAHTNTRRQSFEGSHPHKHADTCTQTTKALISLSSPFVLIDRDKTSREPNDLMCVKLRELIIQKLHFHKYVYQYAKQRQKVGQNFSEVFEHKISVKVWIATPTQPERLNAVNYRIQTLALH